MKIRSIEKNQTEVTLNNGVVVFVSYSTPVAMFVPGLGLASTSKKCSDTTIKHMGRWLSRCVKRFDCIGNMITITSQEAIDKVLDF